MYVRNTQTVSVVLDAEVAEALKAARKQLEVSNNG